MNEVYLAGFMDKCAELGINPEALVKEAGPLGSGAARPLLSRIGSGLRTGLDTLTGKRVAKLRGSVDRNAESVWHHTLNLGREQGKFNGLMEAIPPGQIMTPGVEEALDRLGASMSGTGSLDKRERLAERLQAALESAIRARELSRVGIAGLASGALGGGIGLAANHQ